MKQKRRKHPSGAAAKPKITNEMRPGLSDTFRQMLHPPEWRIDLPVISLDQVDVVQTESIAKAEHSPQSSATINSQISDRMVTEVATCLWDIERKLRPVEGEEPERQYRLAYRRVIKAIDALKKGGIEIKDPTGDRYPQGGENMMRPIQFQPTPGLTFERVTDTVAPIIYCNERLIQRGEVFVAVPQESAQPTDRESIGVAGVDGSPASIVTGNSEPKSDVNENDQGERTEISSPVPEEVGIPGAEAMASISAELPDDLKLCITDESAGTGDGSSENG